MDFIMVYRLLDCMRKGLPPDMDVYDAASWSAPGPLSLTSLQAGAPPKFPRLHSRPLAGPKWSPSPELLAESDPPRRQ